MPEMLQKKECTPDAVEAQGNLIEVADVTQIEAVVALAHETWHEHYAAIISTAQIEYMLAKFQSVAAIQEQLCEGYRYYLIRWASTPVGYIGLLPEVAQKRFMISKLYLKKNVRGQGLGFLALDFASAASRDWACTTLWLTVNKNNPTLAWYLRQGFQRTREVVADIGQGFVMDDYILEKTV